MPNEPAESDFKHKVRAVAYPTRERGGVVWAYLGPKREPPPLPDLEPNNLPDGDYDVWACLRDCNYLQAMEGDIDTSHFSFLHFGHASAGAEPPGTFREYVLRDRAPRYQVVDTDFGCMYSAFRPADDDQVYHRIANFLFPFYTMTPTSVLGLQIIVRAWVPMDDEHTMFFSMGPRGRSSGNPVGTPGMEMLPNTSDWYGRFRLVSDAANDYRIDRELQRRKEDFTGIAGIHTQDQAITESMGTIYDRTSEHLGTSDAMVIRVRRRLMEAARALAESGTLPASVDHPEVYRQRSGGVLLPKGVDWVAATRELRQAYAAHPELDPALAGGLV
jgi:phenylpropionate dioxygenase-like ring-hydroxylating dioxygenase large terminal subunit